MFEKGGKNKPEELASPPDAIEPVTVCSLSPSRTVKRTRQEASGGATASAQEMGSPTGAGGSGRGQGGLDGASPPTLFKAPRPARPLADAALWPARASLPPAAESPGGAAFFKLRSQTEEAAKFDQLRSKSLKGIIKSGGASTAASGADASGIAPMHQRPNSSGRRRGASEASRAETPAHTSVTLPVHSHQSRSHPLAPSNTQVAPSGSAAAQAAGGKLVKPALGSHKAAQASPTAGVPPGFVSIRVGGAVFEASEDTLLLIPGSVFETLLGEGWRGAAKKQVREIGILLPNNQRQHRTLHIQKDVLPYALC